MHSIWIAVMRGDLAAAHALTASLSDSIARIDVIAVLMNDWNQAWAINSPSRQKALRQFRRSAQPANYYSLRYSTRGCDTTRALRSR